MILLTRKIRSHDGMNTACGWVQEYRGRIPQSRSPQAFWPQGPVSWKTIFSTVWVGGGRFGDDSSTLHLLCILSLLWLHQFHLRSSGIRSQSLETPALEAKERRDTFDSFSHIIFVFAYFLKGSHSYICCSDSTHGPAFFQFVCVGRAASAWPRAGAASLTTPHFSTPAPLRIQKSIWKRAQG